MEGTGWEQSRLQSPQHAHEPPPNAPPRQRPRLEHDLGHLSSGLPTHRRGGCPGAAAQLVGSRRTAARRKPRLSRCTRRCTAGLCTPPGSAAGAPPAAAVASAQMRNAHAVGAAAAAARSDGAPAAPRRRGRERPVPRGAGEDGLRRLRRAAGGRQRRVAREVTAALAHCQLGARAVAAAAGAGKVPRRLVWRGLPEALDEVEAPSGRPPRSGRRRSHHAAGRCDHCRRARAAACAVAGAVAAAAAAAAATATGAQNSGAAFAARWRCAPPRPSQVQPLSLPLLLPAHPSRRPLSAGGETQAGWRESMRRCCWRPRFATSAQTRRV